MPKYLRKRSLGQFYTPSPITHEEKGRIFAVVLDTSGYPLMKD